MRPVDDEFEHDCAAVSAFVDDVWTAASGAAPAASPQLMALFADGLSSDKVDLPATAPRWRYIKMRVSRALAGLGVAAKVLLGAGIAAASATAAGAAGVLPAPAQSAVAHVVDTVTPFSMSDGSSHPHDEAAKQESHEPHDTDAAGPAAETPPSTTTPSTEVRHDGDNHSNGDGGKVITPPVPPTSHEGQGSDPSTGGTPAPAGDDHHDAPATTPTTEHHVELSMALHCTPAADAARVACEWSAPPDGTAKVVLLRVTDGEPGRVPYQSDNRSVRSFADTTVASGHTYGYRVDALRADGSVLAASPMVYVTTATAPPPPPPPAPPAPSGDQK